MHHSIYIQGFIAFTGGLSFLFAIGEIITREKSYQSYIQALLFLLGGIFQTHTVLVGTDAILLFPHLYLIHLPLAAFLGALLKRYFSSIWREDKGFEKINFWELAPSAIIILLLLPYYASNADEKRLLFEKFPVQGIPLLIKLSIVIVQLPIFYSIYYVFKQIFRYVRWEMIQSSAHLRLVFLVLFISGVSGIIGFITISYNSRYGLDIVSSIFGVLIIWVYFMRQRNPELMHEVKRIVQDAKKYQTTQLSSVNLDEIGNGLKHLMEEEKIYREDELNLSELASRISLSPHQLSEYLNLHLGKNFFQFVNFYRIKEAKTLCAEKKEKTILSIAYEVGFPSKSTFYDAFRRETGMSPTEYRKKIKS
ncbi:AraC family transcriptional regulator [Leptospira ilyithenensis]|uniref:AraC family transcriptional regulator n=1 Tax=Leptospira ilyithenensis TaxID=2484901 RepID=UPI001FE64833|nr:helix-turn-helix domain-containing protein [Leptospira ilyithenensis]